MKWRVMVELTGNDGRWCTRQTKSEMGPKPICYAMTGWRRTESGRPVANIRFRTATPMAASVYPSAEGRG
jgi:hypothetical protein